MKKASSGSEGEILHELQIDVIPSLSISAIHFVLKVPFFLYAPYNIMKRGVLLFLDIIKI